MILNSLSTIQCQRSAGRNLRPRPTAIQGPPASDSEREPDIPAPEAAAPRKALRSRCKRARAAARGSNTNWGRSTRCQAFLRLTMPTGAACLPRPQGIPEHVGPPKTAQRGASLAKTNNWLMPAWMYSITKPVVKTFQHERVQLRHLVQKVG